MPPQNPPPGGAAAPRGGALSVRRILAPAGALSPVLAWETHPGATCVAGSRLGTLRSEPGSSGTGGASVADFLCLLLFLMTCGFWRVGRVAGERVLTAPEDGVLLWLLPAAPARRLRRGEPLATYFPLREWQAYEQLLKRQEAIIRAGQGGALPSLRAEAAQLQREVADLRQQVSQRQQEGRRLLQGGLDALAEQLLARQAELDPAGMDAT